LIAILLVAFLASPLLAILLQALEGREGEFVWPGQLHCLRENTGAAGVSLWNSVWVSCWSR
jgi:iron(III) transport system permease protein